MSFILCPGCSRHVKGNDVACPFCGASTDAGKRVGDPALRGARVRHRLLFGAATAAVAGAAALNGCSAGEVSGSNDGGSDAGSAQPGYGSPAPEGGFAPPYGIAAFDSGAEVDSGAVDASSDSGDAGD